MIDIQYPCPPLGNSGCVVWESAILHPSDLLSNKQGSLEDAAKTFAVIFIASFVYLQFLVIIKKIIDKQVARRRKPPKKEES